MNILPKLMTIVPLVFGPMILALHQNGRKKSLPEEFPEEFS
jgi:hypothetical protein